MKPRFTGLCLLVAALAVAVYSSAFVVDGAEQAFVVRFGAIRGDAITRPGLHWKVPLVDEVRRFDRRLLAWDGGSEQVPTLGREFVLVDTSARLRIVDARRFLESLRDERSAQNRLDDVLRAVVRNKVSGARMEEIIRGGDGLEREILQAAQPQLTGYGVELSDVRITGINYVASVREQVVNRMISERQSIAEKYRSEGRGRSAAIFGETQRDLQAIRSEASRKAEEIRGEADGRATRIYGRAYAQNAEFYRFLDTLETQRETMGPNTTLMISGESDFYRSLSRAGRGQAPRPPRPSSQRAQ